MPTTDFGQAVETTLAAIDESDEIHPDNKQAIHDFKRDLSLEGLSDAWLQKLTAHLKVIAEHLGAETRFEDLDEDDIKDIVEWVQGRDLADATVDAYKQVLKRFYRWLYDLPEGEHPEPTAWITTTSSASDNDTLPTDLLTPEEVNTLIESCKNPRDEAFIALLWETGARIGELIDLTVSDIEDNRHGKKVVIDGKTGQRRLPLFESVPHLNSWLNRHPSGESSDPLWCQLNDAESQLSYHYIRQKLLVRAKERAGLDKPVNPHHFRHSRATYLAGRDEFNEYKLCEWFGWVIGSNVPSKYIHLSGAEIDDAYGRMHGLVDPEEDENGPQVVKCPRCEELNRPEARFCSRCGMALDVEAASSVEAAQERVKESYKQVDPEDTETIEKLEALDAIVDNPEDLTPEQIDLLSQLLD